jgi:hypothetical protein
MRSQGLFFHIFRGEIEKKFYLSLGMKKLSSVFFAEYHGKTRLDQEFARVKSRIRLEDVSLPTLQADILAVINRLPDALGIAFDPNSLKEFKSRRVRIPDITAFNYFSYDTNTCKFSIEKREYALVERALEVPEEIEEDGEIGAKKPTATKLRAHLVRKKKIRDLFL